MKNTRLLLPALAIVAALSSCKKLKFDDEPYLKYTVNGTEASFNNESFSASVFNLDGTRVWTLQNACVACENSFYLQANTDIDLNAPHPVLGMLASDDAVLYLGNVQYNLYNGVVKLAHMSTSVEPNAYMEGTFSLTLINQADNTDTLQVTGGSFFHNNYSISG